MGILVYKPTCAIAVCFELLLFPVFAVDLQGCMFTNKNASNLLFDFSKAGAAVELALQYAADNILPADVRLKMHYVDLGNDCPSTNHAAAYALDIHFSGIQCNVYFGPGCTQDVMDVYDVSDFLRVPLIALTGAGVGAGAELNDYPSLSRISVTHTNTASILLRFLDYFNYTNVAVIVDRADRFYMDMYSVLRTNVFKRKDSRLLSNMVFKLFTSGRPNSKDQLRAILEEAQAIARVFFVLANGNIVRWIMIEAQNHGMVGSEYVSALISRSTPEIFECVTRRFGKLFVVVELFRSKTWGSFSWKRDDGQNEVARKAFSPLVLVSYRASVLTARDDFDKEIRKRSSMYGYAYGPNELVEATVSHFYDMIVFYASLIANLSDSGQNISDNEAVWTLMTNFTFRSPVNGLVRLDENADRQNHYVLDKYSVVSGRYEPFLDFPMAYGKIIVVDKNAMNDLPPNIPRCGFKGDNPACTVTSSTWRREDTIAAVLAPLFMLLGAGAAVYFGFRRYLTANYEPFWWRIFMHDLLEPHHDSTISSLASRVRLASTASATSCSNKDRRRELSQAAKSAAGQSLFPTCNRLAVYKGDVVGLKDLPDPKKRSTADIGYALMPMRRIQHRNLQNFVGIAVNDENFCIAVVGELCPKGNLECLLKSKNVKLDEPFKVSLLGNLVSGIQYIHTSPLISHGYLMETTCLIDARFVLRISDFGLGCFRSEAELRPPFDNDSPETFYPYLWRAPEFLRKAMGTRGSQKGDIYSLAILLQQIVLQKAPFGNPYAVTWADLDTKVKDIILEVRRGSPPVRPRIPRSACPVFLYDLIEECWAEDPDLRPSIQRVIETMKQHAPHYTSDNILDHLIKRMEGYAAGLESEVDVKTHKFMEEKRRGEEILCTMLPKFIAEALNQGKDIPPEMFLSATILFSKLDGFENLIASAPTPADLTFILNSYYVICDRVVEKYDVYKIASGLPVPNDNHAEVIAILSLSLAKHINGIKFESSTGTYPCTLRVGLSSGPCVGGIVGTKLPRYCVFGDTVNTASRMETSGQGGKTHVSPSTQALLTGVEKFVIVERGQTFIKGKGMMTTYWLCGYSQPFGAESKKFSLA